MFYQVLAADDKTKSMLHLADARIGGMAYTLGGGEAAASELIEGKTEPERFSITCNALGLIGVDEKARLQFLRAIAVVLNLGQLLFETLDGDTDRSQVQNEAQLEKICQLSGCQPADLALAFTERTMTARGEIFKVQLKQGELSHYVVKLHTHPPTTR